MDINRDRDLARLAYLSSSLRILTREKEAISSRIEKFLAYGDNVFETDAGTIVVTRTDENITARYLEGEGTSFRV